MDPRPFFLAMLLGLSSLHVSAMDPPKLLDPSLRLEALCTVPDIESPTTVVGAPDGSFYVGCDPRDARLNTDKPECYIVRFSSMGAEKKRTIFADTIFSPAGSVWHDGWLYIAHDPFLTRFRDTDGDGIADVREDLITNLGHQPYPGLNDHCASGFTLGMDGFFYLSIGDRGTFQTRSVKDGSTISLQGGGIIRFRPDGTALEIFSTGTRNHLAVCLDAEDNAFTLDNTDDGNGWWTRLTHHIEGGYYGYPYDYQKAENFGVTQPSQQTFDAAKRAAAARPRPPTRPRSGDAAADDAGDSERGRGRVGGRGREAEAASDHSTLNSQHSTFPFLPAMTDFGGGSPTGGLCYLSDGLPEPYRGKLLFSEWGKGGLFVIEVARDGATFRFVKNTPLIQGGAGSDFRPMQLSVAADGSLLIADWQWGGWKGPKTVGNIWRLSWPEAHPAPRLKDESTASVEELLAALAHPDRDRRLRAQGEFVKRLISTYDEPFEKWNEITGPFFAAWRAARAAKDPNVVDDGEMSFAEEELWWGDRHKLDDSLSEKAIKVFGRPMAEEIQKIRQRANDRVDDLLRQLKSAAVSTKAPILSRIQAVRLFGDLQNVRMRATPTCGEGSYIFARAAEEVFALGVIDENPRVREQAVRALANFRSDDNPITYHSKWVPLLLNDIDAGVRYSAIRLLGKIEDNSFVRALIRHLDDSDANVRFGSSVALGDHLGRGVGLVLPPDDGELLDGLSTSSATVREGMWHTVGRCNDWENGYFVVELISSVIKSGGIETRTRAATALGATAYKPKPWDGHWWGTQPVKNPPPLPGVAWEGTGKAIETLTAALADADSGVRLAAAQAFANFLLDDSGKPATAALRARLTAETDPAIRRQIIESLGVQKDPQAMEVFRQIALGDPDMNFRETAIAAVVNIGGDDARKTIAQLASAQLSPAATRKIIQAAGELKVLEAAAALIAHLSDENAGDRESAIKSLAAIFKEGRSPNRPAPRSGAPDRDSEIAAPWSAALDALVTALADKDAKVQTAAVEAIGSFKDKRALPALLDFSKTKRARRETINAIAALMPDPQALPFLVDALREKGTGERRSALTALKKMRAEAWPMIEQNLASGRIPAEFAPEIRLAFDSGVIAKWKLIGPFENVWEAVHPPEEDMLRGLPLQRRAGQAEGSPPNPLAAGAASHVAKSLALRYTNAEGKGTGWNDVSASADEGRVDLGKIFKTSGMVCAYAFTEIESPEDADAKLLCGSDDQIAVWLNGKKLHDSGPGSRSLNVDQDEVPIHFSKGHNALLVKIGNVGGGWEFAARIPGLDGGKFTPSKEPAPEVKQRAFSLATNPDGTWQNPGDAARGEKLFHDPTAVLGGLCATCHKVRGLGKEIGPDLSLVGSIYKRADLIVSILEPSKTIALGFDQNLIETNGGETFIGALRQETGEAFTLVGADAQPHVIKKTDVKTRKPIEQSLIPIAVRNRYNVSR